MKFFFIFLFFYLSLNAKTYSLYLASSKYASVAKQYHEEIQSLLNTSNNIIVKVTANDKYSVLIKEIPNINKAKELQRIFKLIHKFEDSYIKKILDIERGKREKEKVDLSKEKEKTINLNKQNKINKTINLDSTIFYNHDIESTNDYVTASTMYNIKEYKQAYKLFQALFLKYTFNININYFLAKSAIKINKRDEAITAFERILIQNPKSHKIRFEFAKLLMKQRLLKEAEQEFLKLLKSNIKIDTKRKIKNILLKLYKRKKTYFANALLMLEINRSSNINNGLKKTKYKLPGLNDIIVEGESPIKDWYFSSMLNINIYHPLKQNKNLIFKNSFLFYKENFKQNNNFNSLFLKYETKLSYHNKKNLYAFSLDASRVDQYLDSDFNIFSFTSSFNRNKIYTYLQYKQINYLNDKYKGKEYKEFVYYLNYNIIENLNYYVTINKIMKKYDLRTDVNKFSFFHGFNYLYKVNKKNEINFEYKINLDNYEDKNFFLGSTRKDVNHNVLLGYKYIINNNDNVNIAYTHTKNNSNQDPYKYTINKVLLSYIKSLSW